MTADAGDAPPSHPRTDGAGSRRANPWPFLGFTALLVALVGVVLWDAHARKPVAFTITEMPVEEARRVRAIERGLAWLAKTQEPDGSWDLAKWNPWHGKTGLHGFTEEDHHFGPAATGLVALAFLEARPAGSEATPFAPPLAHALARLAEWQLPDGRIGLDEEEVDAWFREKFHAPGLGAQGGPGYKALTIHSFNHAVAAAAFAVAARASRDERWLEAARRALRHFAADEHPEYRWTAYYDPESDIGVVAYVVLAARAGHDAGLVAEAAPLLATGPDFLDRVTDVEAGRTRMLSDNPACFDGDDSTAINAYCRRLLGEAVGTATLRALLASLARRDPAWVGPVLPLPSGPATFHVHLGPVVNHDAFLFGTRALAGAPGARGAAYGRAVTDLVLDNQVATGPEAGSWEPIGVWDRVGGRVYATAMAVRTLAPP